MRSPTKWVELAVAVLGLVIGVGGTTKADLILDQSFSQGSYIASTGGEFAQTFTVGLNGLLGQVDIGVQTLTNATLDIVRTSAAGIPSNDPSAVLASMSLPTVALSGTPALPTWVGIDLSAYDIQVNTGEILALTLQGGEVWFVGFSNHVPIYSGGSAWVSGGGSWETFSTPTDGAASFYFATYVETPEPSTLVPACITGLMGLGYAWRRRKAKRAV